MNHKRELQWSLQPVCRSRLTALGNKMLQIGRIDAFCSDFAGKGLVYGIRTL